MNNNGNNKIVTTSVETRAAAARHALKEAGFNELEVHALVMPAHDARREIAIHMMAALTTAARDYPRPSWLINSDGVDIPSCYAKRAVQYADALIKELTK